MDSHRDTLLAGTAAQWGICCHAKWSPFPIITDLMLHRACTGKQLYQVLNENVAFSAGHH
jgi:hypothetical protein